ncbi:MAG TPA: hypothetical protein VFV38_04310 [Ktedonobacteraceae bacterium]|nr:hypothetical protein [Ktedonobacteraceae bacterium]
MQEANGEASSVNVHAREGVLLGIILDLSDSMRESMQAHENNQVSRIESLAKTFQQVLEDTSMLVHQAAEQQSLCRMFMYGFGFQAGETGTWTSQIGDIFSILIHLQEHIDHYKPLQEELETLWLHEVEETIEQGRISGDAKKEFYVFVEQELRKRAIEAEKKRNAAKFQRWCIALCQRIDAYDARLRTQASQHPKFAFLLLPLTVHFLWILRGPALLIAHLNKLFETWLKRKLKAYSTHADQYADQQAEKVVILTQKALTTYHTQIVSTVEQAMIEFIDGEAAKIISLYNRNASAQARKQSFDRKGLRDLYHHVVNQMHAIMNPHANFTWEKSVFLLKRATKVLKITPDWNVLREKTLDCAHQIVWEAMKPEIGEIAKVLVKERFIRAVLTVIIQTTKDQATTLPLQKLGQLLQSENVPQISLKELPIFGSSPLGLTLTKTFTRLWHEVHLPQNKGLHPAIVIVSDGYPTDFSEIDSASLAEHIKQAGIPIICCFVTNKNIGRAWLLRQRPRRFWSSAARLMFSMSSIVDEWPEFGVQLKESRFVVQKQAKLFVQLNHTEYLRNFIEAVLLPASKERKS